MVLRVPALGTVQFVESVGAPRLPDHPGGSVKKIRFDARSRAKDDNRLKLTGPQKKIVTARKINKGLAMELVMASLLTFVGHPREVLSHCVSIHHRRPNNFVQGDNPDIVYRPANANPSVQVVCEVSANAEMNDESYRKQLEAGLKHARKEHCDAGVKVTYLLVANLRKIGEDKSLQAVYRVFQAARGNNLHPPAPIRVVPMRASEFATAVRRLHHEDTLRFPSSAPAQAFDALHEKIWAASWPDEEDWMAEVFVETVRHAAISGCV